MFFFTFAKGAILCFPVPHPAGSRIQDTTMRLKQYELEEAQIWQAQLAHAEQRVADYYAQVWVVERGCFFKPRLD